MVDLQGSKAPRTFPAVAASVDDLAHRVIGAAIEVHRHVGPGFSEAVYEEALAVEFRLRELPFTRQHPLAVSYKGYWVGEGRADFVVGDSLVVEVKAVRQLVEIHTAQVISYLKAGDFHLGLLLNFREAALRRGVKRVVWRPSCLEGDHRANQVQERKVAYGGLIVASSNAPETFEGVEEDLDAVA